MHLKFRGINDAFRGLVGGIHSGDIPTRKTGSRYGEVLQVEEPVIVTYSHPRERVLFNAARDVNPFFLMYEALWMLAGRNDVAPLAYYCSRMPEFSDDGKTFNGAYGYRWTCANDWWGLVENAVGRGPPAVGIDQLKVLIDHLRCKPESRRAVLQMWNVEDDLLRIDTSKDVCCNLSVCFSIREQLMTRHPNDPPDKPGWVTPVRYLDMTVFNRSNDLIWGTLGANVVHFSLLQEYVAAHLGVEVGIYNQVTNNLHVYTNTWKPEEWLECEEGEARVRYYPETEIMPLVEDPSIFDEELLGFVEDHSKNAIREWITTCEEPFLRKTAQLMCVAYHHRKNKDLDKALAIAERIEADDWRMAACGWINRRIERRMSNVRK